MKACCAGVDVHQEVRAYGTGRHAVQTRPSRAPGPPRPGAGYPLAPRPGRCGRMGPMTSPARGSRAASAPSPSPPRSPSTPRPRPSRPPGARSSASAPASPTSRPPTTSSRRRSRPAATRGGTATPRPAGCPSCKEAIAAKTLRDSGYEVTRQPGARHQRRQAGALQRVRHAPRPGRRGAAAGAVLDHLPRVDPARRRRARRGHDRRDLRLPRHRRAARGRAHRRAPRCWCSSRRPTRPARSTPPPRSRRSAAGPLEHGIWVVTDEIYEHLVYGDARVLLDARRSCPSSPTAASSSTAWPRPTP